MRFIPTGIHGVLDYLTGVVLIGIPFVVGFVPGRETAIAIDNAATYVPVVLGFGLIIYSLFTNYEVGVVRKIPMRVHLALDAISGGFLAVSPWLFGFADYVLWPHVILGVIELVAANTTQTEPFTDRRGAAAPATHGPSSARRTTGETRP